MQPLTGDTSVLLRLSDCSWRERVQDGEQLKHEDWPPLKSPTSNMGPASHLGNRSIFTNSKSSKCLAGSSRGRRHPDSVTLAQPRRRNSATSRAFLRAEGAEGSMTRLMAGVHAACPWEQVSLEGGVRACEPDPGHIPQQAVAVPFSQGSVDWASGHK